MIKLRKRRVAVLPLLVFLLTAAAMALFLLSPVRYTESVLEGVSLWAVSVLPATFPFLFLTAIFTRQKPFAYVTRAVSPVAGKVFRISGAGGCAVLLSVLSGYPVGARAVADLRARGALSDNEVFRVACVATTTGPMFLVGAVGARMYGSAAAGWVLFAAHLFSVCFVGLLLRLFDRKKLTWGEKSVIFAGGGGLSEALIQSVLSVLTVGGAIALFYAFGQMLADVGAFAGLRDLPLLEGTVRGLLEMTSGISLLSRDFSAGSLALSCFLVTFGGACVLVQQLAFLTGAGVKPLPFLLAKFVQGVLAGGIAYGLFWIIL